MRTKKEFLERLALYKGIEYFYDENIGFIAWQISTGENVEIMFIETKDKRKGHGKELLKRMVANIKPYNSVFVFRLASNEDAGMFYRALGFEETLIKGLYKVDAVLGVVSYQQLIKMLN